MKLRRSPSRTVCHFVCCCGDYAWVGQLESVWAIRRGHENRRTIELARRHCLNIEFVQSGGRGMVEAETGLPVNTRQVRCPVAIGPMSANLSWIASDFYQDHCIGCSLRRPTGDVPNLATVVEERAGKAAQQAALETDRISRAREQWSARVEVRRAIAATGGEAMADAIANIAILDQEPGTATESADRNAARERLMALAARVPWVFTQEVVTLALDLVTGGVAMEMLDPLRRLAGNRREFAEGVLHAALAALRRGPDIGAGRCVADFADLLRAGAIDEQVCRSLVLLAGEPRRDRFGFWRPNQAADPTGLRAVAGMVPELLVVVLGRMLPPPFRSSRLILPEAGLVRPVAASSDRAAAAGAIKKMAVTHPDLAARMTSTLILNLGAPPDDSDDDPAIPAITHALAVMLVLGIGDVVRAAEEAGRYGGGQLRESLFGIFTRAADLLDPEARWREPGDPTPDTARRVAVMNELFSVGSARLSGEWGDEVRRRAAELICDLAQLNPQTMLSNLPAMLGAVLVLVESLQAPPPRELVLAEAESAELRALERLGREYAISGAASRVLDAVEAVAESDPRAVCTAVTTLIAEERDTARGPEVVWRLLRTLGQIGRERGDERGVLQEILPTLHSYLVDPNPSLRARAIDQWVEIGQIHQLPESLADLLPALVGDLHVVVARAVLRAARSLSWTGPAQGRLLIHAMIVLDGVDPTTNADAIKEAIYTATWLARDDEQLLAVVERHAIERATALDGYDLRDVLQLTWQPATARSSQMAHLRLRQASDPRINDRFTARDDAELCALLDCDLGLSDLPSADLTRSALAGAPQYPLVSAEFAEVAWRAGRPSDAAAMMRAVFDTIPDQPAYHWQIQFSRMVIAAAETDAAAADGRDWRDGLQRTTEAAAKLDDEGSDIIRGLVAATTASLEVRRLLNGDPVVRPEDAERQTVTRLDDPAQERRARADAIKAAGAALAAAAPQETATAHYLRGIAALCDIGAHLLLGDAAALDADPDSVAAHTTAAQRRAEMLLANLTLRFDRSDPLAGPLIAQLDAIADQAAEADVLKVLAAWARLLLPLPVVRGRPPRAGRTTPSITREESRDENDHPIAVVLTSIDGRLVTGPEVLSPNTVHELTIEAQCGPWPDWADRLDAELLTHLTPQDITTPAFTWHRLEHTGDGETYIQRGPLVLRFGVPAGQQAPPFLMRLTWRGERNGQRMSEHLDVTGHRQLRLRPFDATRDTLTNYPVFDERLLALYERLAGAGYQHHQLQAFCRLLTAICRVGLRMTWDRDYRRGAHVTERKFHDNLHERLLREPELDGRLERGSPLALGYLDVRHDGITAELKVERKTPVTEENAPKYIGQPTQYAAADGARLSILTILDMSPKELPIGTPENYLFTLEPRLHGLNNPESPSLVAVLIVNGNMPTPSSWSRKRTPVSQDSTRRP